MAEYEDDEFTCALSGLTPTAAEMPEDGDADPIPLGWTRVTLEYRTANTEWQELQAVKEAMTQQALAQIPEEVRSQAARLVALQVRAQFAALEAKILPHTTETHVVHLAPGSRGAEIQKAIDALYESLGIEEEEEDDEAGDE